MHKTVSMYVNLDNTDGKVADLGVRGPGFKSQLGLLFQLIVEISFFVELTRSFMFKSS